MGLWVFTHEQSTGDPLSHGKIPMVSMHEDTIIFGSWTFEDVSRSLFVFDVAIGAFVLMDINTVGSTLGLALGLDVGRDVVGLALGLALGLTVGYDVGLALGLALGLTGFEVV
jgi:hypothetical protein